MLKTQEHQQRWCRSLFCCAALCVGQWILENRVVICHTIVTRAKASLPCLPHSVQQWLLKENRRKEKKKKSGSENTP